jgi:hypothetical protein
VCCNQPTLLVAEDSETTTWSRASGVARTTSMSGGKLQHLPAAKPTLARQFTTDIHPMLSATVAGT